MPTRMRRPGDEGPRAVGSKTALRFSDWLEALTRLSKELHWRLRLITAQGHRANRTRQTRVRSRLGDVRREHPGVLSGGIAQAA